MMHTDRLLPSLAACAAAALVLLASLTSTHASRLPVEAPHSGAAQRNQQARVFFETVDITVDVASPLAAYQLELKPVAAAGITTRIVGIEGGEKAPYTDPPYYDPAALAGDRVILAAYSTAEHLPQGRFRIARVHMQITIDAPEPKPGDDAPPKTPVRPDPAYTVTLSTAANAAAQPITPAPTASISIGASK